MKKVIRLLPSLLRFKLIRSMINIPKVSPAPLTFKVAETREELESAFSLLYEEHFRHGYTQKDPSRMRITEYHALPSTTVLIAKMQEEVVGTMTVVRDSVFGLPADKYTDLSELRRGGDRTAEISSLAIRPEYHGELLFYLMKFMYEMCTQFLGVNHLVASLVSGASGVDIYKSVLFFKEIPNKENADFSYCNQKKLTVMHLNLDEAHRVFEKAYSKKKGSKNLFRFFTQDRLTCNQHPDRRHYQINYSAMNEQNFKYFLVERTTVLRSMGIENLKKLKDMYLGQPQERIVDQALSVHNVLSFHRKRVAIRHDVSQNTLAKVDNQRYVQVRLLDVSREGLRLTSKERIGEQIEIVLKVESGKIHHIVAQKAWEDQHGIVGMRVLSANQIWNEMINYFENQESELGSNKAIKAG